MQIVSVSAFKGGVGKTTLSVLLANAFASAGMRVLVIDLDHQINSTLYFLPESLLPKGPTIADAIELNDIRSSVFPSYVIGVDIIPGSYRILDFRNAHTSILGNLLTVVEDQYDFCVIDCPPTLDNLVVGSWKTAHVILTPIRFDSFDLEGMNYLDGCIQKEVDARTFRRLVVPNMVEPKKNGSQRSLDLRYEDAFYNRYPSISRIHIPRRVIFRKVLHDNYLLDSTRRNADSYKAILALAEEVAHREIVPREGKF